MRLGRRHRPFYRIVVIEAYKPRNGEYIESIGTYDPLASKGKKLNFNKERYDYWVGKGAQPSDAVLKLILPVEEKKKLWPDKPKKIDKEQNQEEQGTDASKDSQESASQTESKEADKAPNKDDNADS